LSPALGRPSTGTVPAILTRSTLIRFFQYSRAAKELWKFCNPLQVEVAAVLIRDQPPSDW